PAVLAALEDALTRLDVRVRRARGPFRSGLCTVDGAQVVVLNRQHPPEAHVVALAEALRQLGRVDELYLRPAVRAALEEAWAQADAGVTEDTVDDDA
ncbi:MAG: hypothetical protein AAF170_19630, partial [Bacteroidota bacterium]